MLTYLMPNTAVSNVVEQYQDNVQAVFHFANSITNTGTRAAEPQNQTSNFDVFGSQLYNSKPVGGSHVYFNGNPWGTANLYSYNFGGVRRLHHTNYDAFPMYQDFTWEAWVYITDLTQDNYIWGRGAGTSSTLGSYIRINLGGLGMNVWYCGTTCVSSTTVGLFSANTWYHIAVTRSGNTWSTWVNGVNDATGTNSTTAIWSAQNCFGGDAVATNFAKINACDFRFTKFVSRYNGTFTPPTAPLPDYKAQGANILSDPYWSSVSCAFHFDGTNASTTFTDSSNNQKTLTRTSSQGTMAVLSTSQPRYGTASLILNQGYSTVGANVSLPSSSDFDFGTGDFTIEFWAIRNGQVTTSYVFSNGSSSLEIQQTIGAGNYANTDDFGRAKIIFNGSTLITSTNGILSDGYWKHVALVRISGVLYLYIDGYLQGSSAFTNSLDISNSLFGRRTTSDTTTCFRGNIDDLLITKGVGRYSSPFTRPKNTFSNV